MRKYKIETGVIEKVDHRKLYYVTAGITGMVLLAFIALFVVAALVQIG